MEMVNIDFKLTLLLTQQMCSIKLCITRGLSSLAMGDNKIPEL